MNMDRPHFAMERTRRVSISIPGYDPVKEVKRLQEKLQKVWKRNKRQKTNAATTVVATDAKVALVASSEEEVEALNGSLQQNAALAGVAEVLAEDSRSTFKG